jgi:hypothetical protein
VRHNPSNIGLGKSEVLLAEVAAQRLEPLGGVD